ncbi:MAG: FAD-dependent oxidoreductase [Mycobacterium sp.]
MPKRILVIGAGIAGLATANALQQHGHDVTVLEERTDTSSGAGISIWPNALAALDEIGLGDAVRAAGGRITAGAMRWRDGTWLRHPSSQRLVKALGEPLVVIHRNELTSVLAGALAEGTLRYGVSARSLVATADGVQVSLSDATTTEADAVVGADGTHSMVARHLNGPLENRYAGYTAWRGVADCSIDSDLAGEVLGPSVEFGHVPLGGDNTYWFATERAPEGRSAPQGELTYLKDKFGTWAEPIPTVLAATDPARVLHNDLYDRDRARQWSRGPIVAVGDAAHPMRPHLGQGGCQGIEDAAILASFVDRTDDLATAFGRFAAFRGPRVRSLVRESKTIGRIVNLPPLLSSAATRATVLGPEALVTRHLATIAARSAFALPTDRDVQPV